MHTRVGHAFIFRSDTRGIAPLQSKETEVDLGYAFFFPLHRLPFFYPSNLFPKRLVSIIKASSMPTASEETYTRQELYVIEAFRDALGRMYTRGGEEWLDTIPEDAILKMGDVRHVGEGSTLRVFEPQGYNEIRELTSNDDLMFRSKKYYGYFYGMFPRVLVRGDGTIEKKWCNTERDANRHNTDWDAYYAVSGTGADAWYKMTPSLLLHAENWK